MNKNGKSENSAPFSIYSLSLSLQPPHSSNPRLNFVSSNSPHFQTLAATPSHRKSTLPSIFAVKSSFCRRFTVETSLPSRATFYSSRQQGRALMIQFFVIPTLNRLFSPPTHHLIVDSMFSPK